MTVVAVVAADVVAVVAAAAVAAVVAAADVVVAPAADVATFEHVAADVAPVVVDVAYDAETSSLSNLREAGLMANALAPRN